MKTICLMILALFLSTTGEVFADYTLKFHRWNEGFRADSEVSFEMAANEQEFTELLESPAVALSKAPTTLYAGCYAVQKAPGRGLASSEESKPKFYKICLR
jgi:hypothetical protein